MKKRVFLAVVAAVIVLSLCVGCLLFKQSNTADGLVGTWMIYEGGNVAPDVLTFNADGTGVAYVLSDTYQDNSMTNVQIPRSCLDHAEDFRWSVESSTLTFIYTDGDSKSYKMSFYTVTDVRMLSLNDGSGGGGYVPAEIAD